ncbi:MAG: hypothetical protein AABX83_01385, partial [Nanoarchaeota archaeon]
NNPYKYVDPSGNEPVTAYIVIEGLIDVASFTYSLISLAIDPESAVNQVALALDIADIISPISNPGPSGLIYRGTIKSVKEKVGKEAIEQAAFSVFKDIEDKYRDTKKDEKLDADKNNKESKEKADNGKEENPISRLFNDQNRYNEKLFSTTRDSGQDGVIYAYEGRDRVSKKISDTSTGMGCKGTECQKNDKNFNQGRGKI